MGETTITRGAGFFTVDRRTWKLLCGLDDINMAVAYLTICAGTGKGNRISRWSAVAIQNYTGLAWKRAKPAIAQLIEAGFLSVAQSTAMRRPVYELQPFDAVLDAARRRISDIERYVMNTFRRKGRGSKSPRQEAKQLVMRGLLWQNGTTFQVEPPRLEAGSDLIWLPNTLVTGTDNGEPSPVKRLRQCRNLDALRLLIDLYHAHNLADDGGISRKVVEVQYRRRQYGHCGNRFVYGFNLLSAYVYPGQACTEFFWQRQSVDQSKETGLWQAFDTLSKMGLLERVPHLVENEDRGSEPIIGIAWHGGGEPLERAVAVAANAAARRMLAEIILDHGAEDENVLVPVLQTVPQVQMVDIYRLRYRPHTEATARWLRQMEEVATEWIQDYDQLAERDRNSDAVSR
ncbi:MAG TPA: hypothetical protein VK608_02820 [Edaphobacter sp.]|nr:hypothetical protein [Edaphobacter sp.]